MVWIVSMLDCALRVQPGRMRPGLHKFCAVRGLRYFQTMARVLLIAYGNPLRCDDGVAWRAAESLRGRFSGGDVEVLRLPQLTPELAEYITHSECVVFVDAAAGSSSPGVVDVTEVQCGNRQSALAHGLTPTTILCLAENLYRATPRAFSVTVTGDKFGHGQSLSPAVEAALPQLISRIESVVRDFLVTRGSI